MHIHCLINLPDIVPSIIYDIANAYKSVFVSGGKSIPGLTGEVLYETKFHNERFGREEFICAVRYSTAEKIYAAQRAALSQGHTLVIYDGFRPLSVERRIAETLFDLAESDPDVENNIDSAPWDRSWFASYETSDHRRGCAIDVRLASVKDYIYETTGPYEYLKITEYGNYRMQTRIHDLSRDAAVFLSPVDPYNENAWKTAKKNPATNIYQAFEALYTICTDAGLTPYASKWWQFNDLDARRNTPHYQTGDFFLTECLSVPPE
jgi:D-alanyl-D-alanine dipeptidase